MAALTRLAGVADSSNFRTSLKNGKVEANARTVLIAFMLRSSSNCLQDSRWIVDYSASGSNASAHGDPGKKAAKLNALAGSAFTAGTSAREFLRLTCRVLPHLRGLVRNIYAEIVSAWPQFTPVFPPQRGQFAWQAPQSLLSTAGTFARILQKDGSRDFHFGIPILISLYRTTRLVLIS
jgi:hypothetical protein